MTVSSRTLWLYAFLEKQRGGDQCTARKEPLWPSGGVPFCPTPPVFCFHCHYSVGFPCYYALEPENYTNLTAGCSFVGGGGGDSCYRTKGSDRKTYTNTSVIKQSSIQRDLLLTFFIASSHHCSVSLLVTTLPNACFFNQHRFLQKNLISISFRQLVENGKFPFRLIRHAARNYFRDFCFLPSHPSLHRSIVFFLCLGLKKCRYVKCLISLRQDTKETLKRKQWRSIQRLRHV